MEEEERLESDNIEVDDSSQPKKKSREPTLAVGTDKQCVFILKSGEQCRAYKMGGSLFCINHNPEAKAIKALAVSEGGLGHAFVSKLKNFKIAEVKDVTTTIIQILNEVRKGRLDPHIANSMYIGLNVLLKSYELADLEAKIQALEKQAERNRV